MQKTSHFAVVVFLSQNKVFQPNADENMFRCKNGNFFLVKNGNFSSEKLHQFQFQTRRSSTRGNLQTSGKEPILIVSFYHSWTWVRIKMETTKKSLLIRTVPQERYIYCYLTYCCIQLQAWTPTPGCHVFSSHDTATPKIITLAKFRVQAQRKSHALT